MRRYLPLLCLSFVLLFPKTGFCQAGAHGDDGLDYRLQSAIALAKIAFNELSEEDFKIASADIYEFYVRNSAFLTEELNSSNFLIRPKEEVKAPVGGVLQLRKATTGLISHADILISRELNAETPVSELTSIAIHEVGHHTGLPDENEECDELSQSLFLNRFSVFVLETVSQKDVLFRAKLYGNISIEQILSDHHNLLAMGTKTKVGKFRYAYHIDFNDRTITLSRRELKNPVPVAPEPAFAKRMHELMPDVSFQVIDPSTPNPEDADVYAKGSITPAQVELFFALEKSPITVEVPSLKNPKNLFYRVTFSNWAKALLEPLATSVSITPVANQIPNWKETVQFQ